MIYFYVFILLLFYDEAHIHFSLAQDFIIFKSSLGTSVLALQSQCWVGVITKKGKWPLFTYHHHIFFFPLYKGVRLSLHLSSFDKDNIPILIWPPSGSLFGGTEVQIYPGEVLSFWELYKRSSSVFIVKKSRGDLDSFPCM